MGEKIIGFHAIEEGLKKASSGSVLYIAREWVDIPKIWNDRLD